MEVVEEFVARAGEDLLMQLRVPMFERLHFDRLDGRVRGRRRSRARSLALALVAASAAARGSKICRTAIMSIGLTPGELLDDRHEIDALVVAQKRAAPDLRGSPNRRRRSCRSRFAPCCARHCTRPPDRARSAVGASRSIRPTSMRSRKRSCDFGGDQFGHGLAVWTNVEPISTGPRTVSSTKRAASPRVELIGNLIQAAATIPCCRKLPRPP